MPSLTYMLMEPQPPERAYRLVDKVILEDDDGDPNNDTVWEPPHRVGDRVLVYCQRCKGNGRIEMLEHCPECKGKPILGHRTILSIRPVRADQVTEEEARRMGYYTTYPGTASDYDDDRWPTRPQDHLLRAVGGPGIWLWLVESEETEVSHAG